MNSRIYSSPIDVGKQSWSFRGMYFAAPEQKSAAGDRKRLFAFRASPLTVLELETKSLAGQRDSQSGARLFLAVATIASVRLFNRLGVDGLMHLRPHSQEAWVLPAPRVFRRER